jgi:hypothetical protein
MSGKDSFVIRVSSDKNNNPLIAKYTNISDDDNEDIPYKQLDVSSLDVSSLDVLKTGCNYEAKPVNRLIGINLSLKDMTNIDTKKVSTVVRDLYFNDICYHGSILPGIEIKHQDKQIYLVTKMIAYEITLKEYLNKPTQEELDLVFRLIFQELDRIIKLGVHHNDFHSENIMVTNIGQDTQVNIIDFGDSICINSNKQSEVKMSKLYNLIKLRFRGGSGLTEQHKTMIDTEIKKIQGINKDIIQIIERDINKNLFYLNSQVPNELLGRYNNYFDTQTGGNNNKKSKSHRKKSKSIRKKGSNTKRSVKSRKYRKDNRRSKSKRYQRKKSKK